MAYAAASDLQARYPESDLAQLTDPEGLAVQVAVLDQALVQAAAVIDGYIGSRYPVPMANPPAILLEFACDIAMYRLQVLRPQNDIEDARKRYEDAIAFLKPILLGTADLPAGPVPDGEPVPVGDLGVVGNAATVGPDRLFSRRSMDSF